MRTCCKGGSRNGSCPSAMNSSTPSPAPPPASSGRSSCASASRTEPQVRRRAAAAREAWIIERMHIHILGICGTFMGGLAALAREAGHRVTGWDGGVYPPMSDQLRLLGIDLVEGYGADQMSLKPDVWVVGNVVSRARQSDGSPRYPLMEAILDAGSRYTSGPQWLAENVLQGQHVLAVAGTHGKTTTTSMLAWVLEHAGLSPGFLVGGVPMNFGVSARLGTGPFVIEADEYDT